MGGAALLAVLSSTSFGVSDVLTGTAVRRHCTAALALWAQLTGLVVLAVAVAVRRPQVSSGSLSPVVVVLIATVVLDQRVHGAQAAGITSVLLGIALIASG